MTAISIAITVFAGLGVGALAGLFGVGGGFLLVPLLTTCLDLPAAVIVGSAGCAVLGPATTSLLARRSRFEDWRLPLILLGGLTIGIVVGARLLDQLTAWSPVGVESAVLLTYGVLLLVLGLWTAIDAAFVKRKRTLPRGWLRGASMPPFVRVYNTTTQTETRLSIPVATLSAVTVGALSGFLGMSGGLVTLPLFIFGFGLRTRMAVKSSLVTVWLVSLQSTVVHASLDHIDLSIVIGLLVGGTIGARLATSWSRRLSPTVLRAGFASLLLACSLFVFARLITTNF